MLDSLTLRVAFGVITFTLFLLFAFVTFRSTRSAFSFWWCVALVLFMAGSVAYLQDGTANQIWGNPLGNGVVVAGAASVWMASRSLRVRPTPWWLVVGPATVLTVVSGFDSPATNDWSGGPLYLSLMGVLIGLSTREIVLIDPGLSRTRWPLILSSGALSLYYLVRFVVFLVDGPRSDVFVAFFGTPSTTLITLLLLVVVSFSMASLSGEQTSKAIAARAARSRQELVDGGAVQRRLLPQSTPDLLGYDVAGACVPSGAVSGDFFDWQRTPRGLVATLADVMGKGVSAALVASAVRSAFQARRGWEPGAAVTAVNEQLLADLSATGTFATLVHTSLDTGTGELHYADAGHGLTVIVRADGTAERLTSFDFPIGIGEDVGWEARATTLLPGDTLLSCSDGALDLYDGTLAALDELAALVRSCADDGELFAAVEDLIESVPPDDDVTLLVLRRDEEEGGER